MPLFLFLFLFLIIPVQTFAQKSTIIPTIDPKKTEAVREMAEKKVQDILQQNDLKSTIDTSTPKSVLGTITQINDTKVDISYKNATKNISFTENTIFINEKKNKIKSIDLKSGQIILAMGYYDQFNNFEAKRIVITTTNDIENKNETVFGTIADLSQSSNVLVLIPIKNKNIQYQIKIDQQTKVIDKNGNNSTISKLKSGQKIVAVIQPDSKIVNTFNVSQIITLDSNSPTSTPKK